MEWDEAWGLTQRALAYTNHTLLPEALEKWPLRYFEQVIPRNLEIIFEINRRFLDSVRSRFPNDDARVARMSLIATVFALTFGPLRTLQPHLGEPQTDRAARLTDRCLRPLKALKRSLAQSIC